VVDVYVSGLGSRVPLLIGAIDNLRFTIGACLFDVPEAVKDDSAKTPVKGNSAKGRNNGVANVGKKKSTKRAGGGRKSCATDSACLPLRDALVSDRLDPKSTDTYGFCGVGNGAFLGKSLNPCLECLRGTDQQAFMANCKTFTF
jgi:hypothetical protein